MKASIAGVVALSLLGRFIKASARTSSEERWDCVSCIQEAQLSGKTIESARPQQQRHEKHCAMLNLDRSDCTVRCVGSLAQASFLAVI